MEVLNRQAEANFTPQGIAAGRPHTAMSSTSDRRTLGSMCPVIIKHEFPNEQKHYIDNVGSEMSASKKRFIYDRPNTAKLHRGNMSSSASGFPRNMSGQAGLTGNAFFSNKSASHSQLPMSATAKPSSSMNLNSADLYSKLLEGQKIKKESRFVIKPARKLNTFSIHSALFKIKKQKEELDGKIRDLEDLKTNFNEMDFYLIANSGAVDYMFNPGGAAAQTDEQSNHFLSFESSEQIDNQQINSLAEINEQKGAAAAAQKRKFLTSATRPKSSVPTKKPVNQPGKPSRAATAKPTGALSNTAGDNKNNNTSNSGQAGASRDQIEMLRGESRDESKDQLGSFDLELLQGVVRVVQGQERNQVNQWGENIDVPGKVKDSIENIGENLTTINQLLNAKRTTGQSGQPIGAIQEEEDDDGGFHGFDGNRFLEYTEDQLHTVQSNGNQQVLGDSKNLPYQQYLESIDNVHSQKEMQQYLHYQQQQQLLQNQQQNNRPNTANPQLQLTTGIYPTFQKKKTSMQRVQSAKAMQGGQYRPFSGAPPSMSQRPISGFNQLAFSESVSALHTRPQTGSVRLHSGSVTSGAKASHHALMSYGPVQIIKERITRNFDHLEILAESEYQEKAKRIKEKKVQDSKLDWQNLKVSGSRLPISSDGLIDLVKQTQDAIAKYQSVSQHSSNKIMQVSLASTDFFGGSHVNKPMVMMHQPQPQQQQHSNQKFNIHVNNVNSDDGQRSLDSQSLAYSQSVVSYRNEQLDSLGQLHSTVSRGFIDSSSNNQLKSLRPATAKQSSSSSGSFLSKPMLNVPVAESLPYKPEDSLFGSNQFTKTYSGVHQNSNVLQLSEQLRAAAQNLENIQALSALEMLDSNYIVSGGQDSVVQQNQGGEVQAQKLDISAEQEINQLLFEKNYSMNVQRENSSVVQQEEVPPAVTVGMTPEVPEQLVAVSVVDEPVAEESEDILLDSNDKSEDGDQFEAIGFTAKKSKFSNRPMTAFQQ